MDTIYDAVPITDKFLRSAIFIAFEGKCFYTGRDVLPAEMHVDHIKPKHLGGSDCIANYVLTCQYINLRKNGKYKDDFGIAISEIVRLVFADKVLSVLNDLRLNDEFIRPNDWLREIGIVERSSEWTRLRHAIKRSGAHSVTRVKDGKARGVVLYRRADLDAMFAS